MTTQQHAQAMAEALLSTMRLAPYSEDVPHSTQERLQWIAVITLLQRAKIKLDQMRGVV